MWFHNICDHCFDQQSPKYVGDERSSESGIARAGNRLSDAENAVSAIIESGQRKLVLDLANVAYIDSAALGMLLVSTGKMQSAGGKLILAAAAQRVLDLIQMTKTSAVLTLADSVEAAVASLA